MRSLFGLLLLLFLTAVSPLCAQPPTAFTDPPALVTSVGQSADIEMIRVLMARARLDFTVDPLITAPQLAADARTLVLVVGGSSKGLGAAGISGAAEMDRSRALIGRARELQMTIIAVHVGGEARRGALSDEFIELCIPAADYVIVVAGGDQDGFISNLAQRADVPVTIVERISAVGPPLSAAFR